MVNHSYQVEVQSDFLEKITRAKPVQALAEFIWNSLDADASTINVTVEENGLGVMSKIIVRDNGTGMKYEKAAREFLQAEKEDQEMEEACKRLIKNCIIYWNYLYLSQKLEEIKDTTEREAFLDAVAHGSAAAWRHFNLLGEYDFSEEKLRDGMGIRLPKLMN